MARGRRECPTTHDLLRALLLCVALYCVAVRFHFFLFLFFDLIIIGRRPIMPAAVSPDRPQRSHCKCLFFFLCFALCFFFFFFLFFFCLCIILVGEDHEVAGPGAVQDGRRVQQGHRLRRRASEPGVTVYLMMRIRQSNVTFNLPVESDSYSAMLDFQSTCWSKFSSRLSISL